jgi:hypothetical protein
VLCLLGVCQDWRLSYCLGCRHIVREELEARKHAQHTNGFAAANGAVDESQEPHKEQ